MPRFKPYDYRQGLLVPVNLEEQLTPGSLEYALHHLIEERVEESWFADLYTRPSAARTDRTTGGGAPRGRLAARPAPQGRDERERASQITPLKTFGAPMKRKRPRRPRHLPIPQPTDVEREHILQLTR